MNYVAAFDNCLPPPPPPPNYMRGCINPIEYVHTLGKDRGRFVMILSRLWLWHDFKRDFVHDLREHLLQNYGYHGKNVEVVYVCSLEKFTPMKLFPSYDSCL